MVSLLKLSDKVVKRLRIILSIIIAISFSTIVYSIYQHWKIEQAVIAQTKINISGQVDDAVSEISLQIGYLMGEGQLLADSLSNGRIAYSDAEKIALDLLKKRKSQHVNFFGVQVAFAKGQYDKNKPEELANFYYFYDTKTKQIDSIKSDYDYTIKNNPDKDSSWYTQAIETKQPFWQEPHFGASTNEFIVGYSIPFFDLAKKEKAIGVVTINLSIDELKTILYAQDYRKTGYSIILSKNGRIVYHPNRITTLAGVTQKNQPESATFSFIKELKENNKQKNADTFKLYNIPKVNKEAWILSKHIDITDWDIYIISFKDELKLEQNVIAENIRLVVASVIFSIALSLYYLLRRYRNKKALWIVSITIGVIFSVGVSSLWYIADISDFKLAKGISPIKSIKEVHDYEQEINQLADTIHKPLPYYIPTGVFIKSTKFDGSNDLNMSGYVWQKYQMPQGQEVDTVPDDFCDFVSDTIPKDKGAIIFEAEEEKIDLACKDITYSAVSDGVITLGWYFKVQLREPFNYSNYPLDKNSIWLRLRPNSWNAKVVLVPDLNAYPFIFESALSGIDAANIVLPSWDILGTFYSQQVVELNSNLGITGYVGQLSHELLFNIIIERDFLDAFISTIIPICIIYLILFVTLFSSLEDILAVLGINAGLLFSVALWHSGLRTSLASSGITYFEMFYFICYFIISLVCINSVLLSSNYKLTILHYQNNLIPKLIFLPLVFGLTFVITLFTLF